MCSIIAEPLIKIAIRKIWIAFWNNFLVTRSGWLNTPLYYATRICNQLKYRLTATIVFENLISAVENSNFVRIIVTNFSNINWFCNQSWLGRPNGAFRNFRFQNFFIAPKRYRSSVGGWRWWGARVTFTIISNYPAYRRAICSSEEQYPHFFHSTRLSSHLSIRLWRSLGMQCK